jgi:hypothetical protein
MNFFILVFLLGTETKVVALPEDVCAGCIKPAETCAYIAMEAAKEGITTLSCEFYKET